MNINAFRIPEQFMEKFPGLKQEKATEYFRKYLIMIRDEILPQLHRIKEDGTVNIYLDKFWAKQFNYKNKTYYIWKEFKDIVPIIYITEEGDNLKHLISKGIILDQNLVNLLIDNSDTIELVKMYYGTMPLSDMVMIPIDMKSLEGYIATTEYNLANKKTNENHKNKMLANLRTAKYIRLISKHYYPQYGMYVLPHIPSKSVYGRTYYKGINLQNVSKEVRSAVLGKHYQYDMYAAVFAIKLYLAEEIYANKDESFYGKFTYTKEYLENKDMIRSRLGKLITAYHDGTKLAKEALTAIGFGARMAGGAWLDGLVWQTSSIKDIIKNKDDFKSFVNDSWLKQFHKEQKLLTSLIVSEYMKSKSFVETIDKLPEIKSMNGNYNKHKIMSYLFQQSETMIMDIITENVNVIVRIHDAFLTKEKITNDTLLQIKKTLLDTSKYFKIDMTEIEGWTSIDIVKDEIEHKEFIKQQERLANGYKSEFIETDNIHISKHYHEVVSSHHDGKCYDGYDEGRNHESYDINDDEYLDDMTLDERREHFRILGYSTNSFPDHIKKIL
jgi:hypothetical protein